MGAARKNITIERGATFAKRFFVVHKSDGSPFDLSNYESDGLAQIREKAVDRTVLGTITVLVPDPKSSGEVRYSISSDDTPNLPLGTKEWDLFLIATMSSGLGNWRLLAGNAKIVPTVSRDT